jgi:hypothetical protein
MALLLAALLPGTATADHVSAVTSPRQPKAMLRLNVVNRRRDHRRRA